MSEIERASALDPDPFPSRRIGPHLGAMHCSARILLQRSQEGRRR